MRASATKRIERNIERTASAIFAVAAAYAAYTYWVPQIPQPTLGAYTGGVGAFAYLLCVRTLHALQPRPRFQVPIFDLRKIDPEPVDELVLTAADQATQPAAHQQALVLDDILAELGPESRVVRLFDAAAMPTPGQLKSRIDRHLDGEAARDPSPDASEALFEALAELRRSLG